MGIAKNGGPGATRAYYQMELGRRETLSGQQAKQNGSTIAVEQNGRLIPNSSAGKEAEQL